MSRDKAEKLNDNSLASLACVGLLAWLGLANGILKQVICPKMVATTGAGDGKVSQPATSDNGAHA